MRALPLLVCILAQAAEAPRFDQFPSGPIFRGTPAPARPRTRAQLLYRTMIRDGAKQGPNFAGHLTVVQWGCGTGCIAIAMVDAKNGELYKLPFDSLMLDADSAVEAEPLSFRLDSGLLIVNACVDGEKCGTSYYEWTGTTLKLLLSKPAKLVPPRK